MKILIGQAKEEWPVLKAVKDAFLLYFFRLLLLSTAK
jgi:hypothetical protein